MATDIRPLRDMTPVQALNLIRKNASNAYQARIPRATKANLKNTFDKIMEYNSDKNEFYDALVNRIGRIEIRNLVWSNDFGKFKQGMLTRGTTIEELAHGLITGIDYDARRDYLEKDLFGQAPADVKAAFHKRNRQQMYKTTINEQALEAAFLDGDNINGFVTEMMSVLATSDEYDEYLIIVKLLQEWHDDNGFFRVNVPDVAAFDSNEQDAKNLLRMIKTYRGKLKMISTHYNAAGMPTAVQDEKMELFLTPEVDAAIDVNALAAAFNVPYLAVDERKTVIQKEDMPTGVQAILTTRDFPVFADTYLGTSMVTNPAGRYDNHFLHHDGIYSLSPFAPAIVFTTQAGDVINLLTYSVDHIDPFIAKKGGETVTKIERGLFHDLIGKAATIPADSPNDALVYTLEGDYAADTRVTPGGILYVAQNEGAAVIAVVATSTFDDSKRRVQFFELTGSPVENFPPRPTISGTGKLEVVPVGPVQDGNRVLIPAQVGVTYKISGNAVSGIVTLTKNEQVIASPLNDDYTFIAGAPATWNVAYTA